MEKVRETKMISRAFFVKAVKAENFPAGFIRRSLRYCFLDPPIHCCVVLNLPIHFHCCAVFESAADYLLCCFLSVLKAVTARSRARTIRTMARTAWMMLQVSAALNFAMMVWIREQIVTISMKTMGM